MKPLSNQPQAVFLKYFFLLLLLANSINLSFAQLNKTAIEQIDSLFLAWNQPNHPGGAIGIMQHGKLVYSKAYGLASLEYLVPNTANTNFNIASISKQFTSMGILILEQQGKLSIDEDIRTYLPELPDFGEKITLRHCMHHTSGMRSLHALLGMAGWRGDDMRNNADLFRLMKKQKDLNFKPGSEYLYCNTGYMLMADIIEKISGEKFADWMKKNIFDPLGLVATYVEDQYNRVRPNSATSYAHSGKYGFTRSTEYWNYVGSGNIHSNTRDLLHWMENYMHPKKGWKALFERMQTVDLLSNGETLYYAFGVDTKVYKGEKRIGHGGSIGGFRSNLMTFPEHGLTVAVLTNFSGGNAGGKVSQIADIILDKPKVAKKKTNSPKVKKYVDLSAKELAAYTGTYYSDELDTQYQFFISENILMGNHTRHGDFKIRLLTPDTLESSLWIFRDIKIKRGTKNKIEGIFVSNGRVRNLWFKKL
jgi:CubicO group peptidase (beta-lactamase class C family)